MNAETFNEFLIKACDAEDWNHDVFPAVWWRHDHDENARTWAKVTQDVDPYDLLNEFVTCGIGEGFESMLLMYGSMAKIDENDENDESTRTRVRVMIYFDGNIPVVAVQTPGTAVQIMDGAGDGVMADKLNAAIRAYKKGETV